MWKISERERNFKLVFHSLSWVFRFCWRKSTTWFRWMWNISSKWVNITLINYQYLQYGVLFHLKDKLLKFLLTIKITYFLFFRYLYYLRTHLSVGKKTFTQFNIIFSSSFSLYCQSFGIPKWVYVHGNIWKLVLIGN